MAAAFFKKFHRATIVGMAFGGPAFESANAIDALHMSNCGLHDLRRHPHFSELFRLSSGPMILASALRTLFAGPSPEARMIETHLLRYALAAAEAGSFSRAAAQFGIKQSTLSRHILYLEDRVGVALFRRSTQGVEPTHHGVGFLRRARHIVADMEALTSECAGSADSLPNMLRLGFQGSLHAGELSALFGSFRSAYPHIEIVAREQGREALLHALEREELDLAIVAGLGERPGLVSALLWCEPIMLCVAADDALARDDRVYWTDLRAREFLVTAEDPGPDLRNLVVARLSGHDHLPTVVTQRVSRDNLAAFAVGDRIALVAGPAAPAAARRYALRPVYDAFGPTSMEYRAYWHRGNATGALRMVLELIADRQGGTLTH